MKSVKWYQYLNLIWELPLFILTILIAIILFILSYLPRKALKK